MFINYATREINCKIVYAGAELAGAADNVRFIYDHSDSPGRGKLTKLNTGIEPMLFFDFVPPEWVALCGFTMRLHLYAVPDQKSHGASRQLILKGVDGVVFVADSQRWRMPDNEEALDNVTRELSSKGYVLREMPYVLQLNHRAAPKSVPVAEMLKCLRLGDEPVVEAVAKTGTGVFETINTMSTLFRQELMRETHDATEEAQRAADETPPATDATQTPEATTARSAPHRKRRDSTPVTGLRRMAHGFLRRLRKTG